MEERCILKLPDFSSRVQHALYDLDGFWDGRLVALHTMFEGCFFQDFIRVFLCRSRRAFSPSVF